MLLQRASFFIVFLLGAVAASNAVAAITVPGAPVIGTATAGNASASIAFTAPTSDGGAVITLYTATRGSTSGTGTASPIKVSNLTNGTTYSCSVKATNAKGTSASSSTKTVIPATLPNKTTTTVSDLRVLMKDAYIGKTTSIPCFRKNTNFNNNKYLGLGTSTPSNGC